MRKRIFFVGIRKDFEYNFEFPNPTFNTYLTVGDAISDLGVIDSGEMSHNYELNPQNDYQELLRCKSTSIYNHRAPNHSSVVLDRIKNIPQGGNHNDLPSQLKLKKGYSNIYGKLSENKPADTITGNCGCASAPGRFLHPTQNRVITVREAARLQSFPDFVIFRGNQAMQYKQVGNAVPPLLSKAVARNIKKSLLSLEEV